MAVDEKVWAGISGPGAVVGGVAGPVGGGVPGPAGVPGPFDARPEPGRTAIPTIGRFGFDTPEPKSGASPKASSSPEVDACQ